MDRWEQPDLPETERRHSQGGTSVQAAPNKGNFMLVISLLKPATRQTLKSDLNRAHHRAINVSQMP